MFELQLSSQVFGAVVRSRLRALPLWRAISDVGDDVIDHITVDDTTTLQREKSFDREALTESDAQTQLVYLAVPLFSTATVPYVQVVQRITAWLAKRADLDANQENPSPLRPFRLDVVMNVAASVANPTQGGSDKVQMLYSYAYVRRPLDEMANMDPIEQFKFKLALKTLEPMLQGFMPPSSDFDVGFLKSASQGVPLGNVRLAGLATNSSGDMVALRMIVDGVPELGSINTSFYTQDQARLLGAGGWAFLVDKQLLLKAASDQVIESVGGVPKFKLEYGPYLTWRPEWPGISVHTRGTVEDVCLTLTGYQDIDVYADVDTTFSVAPQGNELRTRAKMKTGAARFDQQLYCFVSVGLLWPILGPALIGNLIAQKVINDDEELVWAGTLAFMAVPPLVRVALFFIGAQVFQPPIDPKKDTCRKISDDEVECGAPLNITLQLIPGVTSSMKLETVSGTPDGLVLGGNVLNLRERQNPDPVTVKKLPFMLAVRGDCKVGHYTVASAQIQVGFTENDFPGALGDVLRLTADPDRAYELVQFNDTMDVRANPNVLPKYPIALRVRTVNGVRHINFDAPKPFTDEERAKADKLLNSFKRLCQKLQDSITFERPANWGRDIHPDWQDGVVAWQIGFGKLQPSEGVSIKDTEGRLVATGTATSEGSLVMSLMFPTSDAPTGLVFSRQGREGGQEHAPIMVRQTPFVRRGAVAVQGSLQNLKIDRDVDGELVTIADDSGLHSWRLQGTNLTVVGARPRQEARTGLRAAREERRSGVSRAGEQSLRAQGWTAMPMRTRPLLARDEVPMLAQRLRDSDEVEIALFDVSVPTEPRLVQRFTEAPWFGHSVASGRLVARYDEAAGEVVFLEAVDDGQSPDLATLGVRAELQDR